MKQLVFMVLMTVAGTLGVVVVSPFLGVAVYYIFAVLRPQFIWEWSLPPDISWSFYVALATLLAAGGRLLGVGGEGKNLRLTGAHAAVLAFGGWVVISFAMARNREIAYPWFVEYLKIFVMFAASALLIGNVRQVWTLHCAAALCLGYIAYEVNFLYLINGRLSIWQNGYGGLDNNGAGLMLAMGVPLCYFAWEGGQGYWRWGFLLLLPLLLHAVLMTYSRGAMVSLLATMPLIAIRSRHRKHALLAIGGLALLLPFFAGPEIRNRFLSTSSYQQDASAQSRLGTWNAAWHMALDNPIFGVGVRNASQFTSQYGSDFEGAIHSTYLQAAADLGLVGLGIYLTILGATWQSLAKARRAVTGKQDPGSRKIYTVSVGIECAMAVFCVGGLFLSLDIFELPYLLLLMGAQLWPLVQPIPQIATMRPATSAIMPTEKNWSANFKGGKRECKAKEPTLSSYLSPSGSIC